MQQGRWDEAVHACQCALQVQPISPKLHAYLGVCYFRQEKFENAIDSLRRATMLDPQFVDAGVKLAQAYDRLRRYEEAYVVAQEFLRIRPGDRTLQGLVNGLQYHVKGNRTDGWERTSSLAHNVILAGNEE